MQPRRKGRVAGFEIPGGGLEEVLGMYTSAWLIPDSAVGYVTCIGAASRHRTDAGTARPDVHSTFRVHVGESSPIKVTERGYAIH
jgi:hypothetical protein